MSKDNAVESIGEQSLLLPARIKSALAANDRIKLYLSVLQTAEQHAEQPKLRAIDLSREQAAAGVKEAWIDEMILGASQTSDIYFLPRLADFIKALETDLACMARPVLESGAHPGLAERCAHWLEWLGNIKRDSLSTDDIKRLEHGNRDHGDSVHILVMDLHKQLNKLAASMSSEDIDGAHVWSLEASDKERVRAFMRGLNRTAPLKFDHPGLDTAATRDGKFLMLQNDIGTNDAHVLVVKLEGMQISLTYSDLHDTRFAFFQSLLNELGASWSVVEPRITQGLNAGAAYFVGTATFTNVDLEALDHTLEGLGERIVFLIDWNRARKRLQQFVGKTCAIEILKDAARLRVGHMAWLKAGAEHLIFSAMQAAGAGVFRIGDRLDSVLGENDARQFMLEVMSLAQKAMASQGPISLIEDETRVLLARHLQSWSNEFDLLSEHAAYCHELAMAVRDALAHGHKQKEAAQLLIKAKGWERRADELVEQARTTAAQSPRWRPFAKLVELADDVADSLEEASFVFATVAEDHDQAWTKPIREVILTLASSVLDGVGNYVKALATARNLSRASDLEASNAFLNATWRVVLVERQCDDQLRAARRMILKELSHAAQIILVTDLANNLEQASDALMATSYALRDIVLAKSDARL